MAKWVDFTEIKNSVSIEQALVHYGLLDSFRKKGNSLVGPCPIHKGTNKNQFHVSLEKNNFNCFGDCHNGGNVIDFVCKMEDVDIRKGALMLQEWFGLDTKRKEKEKKEPVKKTEPKLVKEEKKENKPLRFELKFLDKEHDYLKARGLSEKTIEAFGLGYCSKGIMKDRIAIPIHNENGELVAYTGRWLGDPPDDESKYKLPAGFHKSLVLYNFYRAKKLTKEEGLILVEGLFDVMRLWQAGYKNAVALLGSSLSDEQEELIVNAVGPKGKVVLMFDADDAGRNCRDDVLKRISPKVFVKVINIIEGAQPDKLGEGFIREILEE